MIYILIVIRWYVSEGEFLGIIVRYWVYYVPYLVVYKLEYFEYMAFSSQSKTLLPSQHLDFILTDPPKMILGIDVRSMVRKTHTFGINEE